MLQQVSSVFADQQPRTDPAEEILRQRFARGEINAEEYERSREILHGGTIRRTYGEDSARKPGEQES